MGGGIEFSHGQTVHRDRRPMIASPTNPARQVPGDWSDATSIALEDAFVASTSSTALANATRSEILTSKSLYLTDATADVKEGDRIRVGGELDDLTTGTHYQVPARPEGDTSPFTGDHLVTEIPLENVKG
ncbi:MAG: hypothetical protein ABIQ01_02190 [Pseudolysinimonas sp.]